jgi:ATP-dependent DNA helicase PIF1
MFYNRFPRREDVERSNSTRMALLGSKEVTFVATDGGLIKDENQRQKMLSNFMAPQVLKLRAEAQVMLIKNSDDMLVNGSMGRVKRFVDTATYGTPEDKEGLGNAAGVVGGGLNGAAGASKKGAALDTTLYPVVEFILPHGGKRDVLILPEMWKVELPSGEVQVSRTQVSSNSLHHAWIVNFLSRSCPSSRLGR